MKGPKGQNRPADTFQRGIMVAKLATGEREESLKEPTQRFKGGKAKAIKDQE